MTIALKNQHEMNEPAMQGLARLINANNIQCIGLENHMLEASLHQLGFKGKFSFIRMIKQYNKIKGETKGNLL